MYIYVLAGMTRQCPRHTYIRRERGAGQPDARHPPIPLARELQRKGLPRTPLALPKADWNPIVVRCVSGATGAQNLLKRFTLGVV